MDDKIGRIAVLIQIAFAGDAAEGEDGGEAHGPCTQNIGTHGVAHHDRLRVRRFRQEQVRWFKQLGLLNEQ